MEFKLNYAKETQTVDVPDGNILYTLYPNKAPETDSEEQLIADSLLNPIKSPKLSEIVKPGEKIAIITSDVTRPMPSYKVLPHVVKELLNAGVNKDDITLVFALGSHRKHTDEEKQRLAGDYAYGLIRCEDSDTSDCVHMGVTSRGTPVDVTRRVAEADRRICLGNVEFHYFAGYSGGVKAIMPGVSTRAAIQSNHSRMVEEKSAAGVYEGNPVREDIEEAGAICKVDFIVNVVLSEKKQIVFAASGHPVAAHKKAMAFLDSIYKKPIKEQGDIVITCAGGYPKDINLYQAQKALDNAKHAVKEGGTIILVGSCKEGLGERVFEEWITSAESPDSLIDRIKADFQLGGHKAAAIALVINKAELFLVSDLEEGFVKSMFMKPFGTVQAAFDDAMAKHGPDAKVIVIPYGGSTLPSCS